MGLRHGSEQASGAAASHAPVTAPAPSPLGAAPPRWDLAPLYAGCDDPRIDADLAAIRREAKALGDRCRGKVASFGSTELASSFRTLEGLYQRMYRPSAYAMLEFATRTDDDRAKALRARVSEAVTEVENELRFVDIEIKRAPDSVVEAWLADAALAPYRHHVRKVRKFAPHTFGEREESLVALKDLTGRMAWSQLYTEVTSAYTFELEADGETRARTLAEARALRSHSDRNVRRSAQRAVLSRFADDEKVLTFCLNAIFQDHRVETRERGYDSPMAPTFLDDELDAATVETLMSSVEAAYPIAQRYYRLKARALGLEADFSTHDLLAPLQPVDKRIAWPDARRLVEQAFGELTPKFSSLAASFFDEARIDAEPRAGKRDGAFCASMVPGLRPFVLANYTGRIDDVSTIAHELGHAVHFALAGEKQTLLNYWPTTPMAETASVFGEMVLVRNLLAREDSPTVRRQILASRIEDVIATVLRQVAYTRWEMNAHAARVKGPVSSDDASSLWSREMTRLYGDAVRQNELDHWGWITIPHLFHYRFYCYSYAFGMLLVFALYKQWEHEGASFVPRYEQLLSAGGSDSPHELLSAVGIDVRARDFWDRGLEVFRGLVDQFEATV
ncbi:MAG: M3 family oligoendopeptidase [Deltaproteobacteria bacterium]|nr:M3 family oligoendopeptidase [Deltaproteobacteria bacterium]